MISEAMLCLVQTMHVPCIKITTISKRTEMSIHMSRTTKEGHEVHPKQFLSLWDVWRKAFTYLALTLTLSPNGRNEILHNPRQLGVPSEAS
jgi:hypothetical protein